jgi:hypothetical protein
MRPTEAEQWQEFEDHFLLRKAALGDCHPSLRHTLHPRARLHPMRFLRVDPAQLPRIEVMTRNAEGRLTGARERVWLGEVAGLESSLKRLRQRRREAENQLPQHTR